MHPKLPLSVRVLIWAGCLTGFLYQTSSMLSLFFEYPFSVTLVEEVRKNILFPAATVCIHRWINITRLCKVFPSTCGTSDQLMDNWPWDFLETDVSNRGMIAEHPDELFKCYMLSTVSSCTSFTCNPLMKMTYYRPGGLMCYTVDNYQWAEPQHPISQCSSTWNYELNFRAEWDSNRTLALREAEVLPLVLHPPYTCPPDKLSSIMLEPGMAYTVSVSQQKVIRLPPPYKSMCSDYVSMGNRKKYFGYFTRDLCIQDCQMKREFEICQCVRPFHEFAGSFGKQACDRLQDDICARKLKRAKLDDSCERKCQGACEETTYDVKLTSLAADQSFFGEGKEKFSFVVKFSSDIQTVSVYQPNLSVIEAFGYFGGYVGIWLGFSLLSIALAAERKLMHFFTRRAKEQSSVNAITTLRVRPVFTVA